MTDPRNLLQETLKAYDARIEELKFLTRAVLAATFSLPGAGLALLLVPPTATALVIITVLGILYFALIGIGPTYGRFRKAGMKITDGRTRLTALTDERVFGLGPEASLGPPALPEGGLPTTDSPAGSTSQPAEIR